MNWLSIPISAIRARHYAFSEPVERATWFAAIVESVDSGSVNECIPFGLEIFEASKKLSHKEGIGAYRTRRARRLAAARLIATHTEEEWCAILQLHEYKCARCGFSGALEKDHVRALAAGGSDGADNLQPLCRSCNSSKRTAFADYRRLK